jgi:hypothetical protein
MGNYKQNFEIAAALLAFACTPALGADQNQSQEDARRTHDNGSDDSLKGSYRNALHAVSNLYQLNIPGAITYGVKAYGQYRNSEKMDDLKERNQRNERRMSSAGEQYLQGSKGGTDASYVARTGPESESARPEAKGGSPFLRIDPAFLRDGETAEIAEKVEKISGISREKMFQMATALHNNNLQRSMSDPDFVPAAKKAYRDFADRMPNEDFKGKLNKAESFLLMLPVQEVMAKFREVNADAPAAPMMAQVPAPVAAAPAVPMVAEKAPEPARDPASANDVAEKSQFASKESSAQTGNKSMLGLDRLQYEPVDGYLGELVKNANSAQASAADDDGQVSIFLRVTNKIRSVNQAQNLDRRNGGPVALQAMASSSNP